MSSKTFEPFVVKSVDFSKIDLVDENNNFFSNVPIAEAKNKAKNVNLDLVCFNEPKDKKLAFCKILNYGKWKYKIDKENKKKQQEFKKKTKELRFSPNICTNDIEHKVRQAINFLESGNDVVFSMKLKGRQKQYFKEAEQTLNDIITKSMEVGQVINKKKSNNTIAIRVGPKK